MKIKGKRTSVTHSFVVLAFSTKTCAAYAGFLGPTVEHLAPNELKQRLATSTFSVLADVEGAPLQINTKSGAIGGFILGSVVSSVFGSTAIVATDGAAVGHDRDRTEDHVVLVAGLATPVTASTPISRNRDTAPLPH
ncbi:hypothetical protein [Burkholderia sp. BE17]|uniref:hypothetical protein n=1 Tax=Burkholderia sp. BE17 TaxID=2656644 RepID=UPI00128DC5A7|nr:hypothetical protein [Burkholderia sp. BE17]MPV71575.1 hypothetical protein [Burkholderia sp. BE17]